MENPTELGRRSRLPDMRRLVPVHDGLIQRFHDSLHPHAVHISQRLQLTGRSADGHGIRGLLAKPPECRTDQEGNSQDGTARKRHKANDSENNRPKMAWGVRNFLDGSNAAHGVRLSVRDEAGIRDGCSSVLKEGFFHDPLYTMGQRKSPHIRRGHD